MSEHDMIFRDDFRNSLEQREAYLIDRGDNFSMTIAGTISGVIMLLNCQPTVDAVEVVRCKDCIHWEDGSCPMDENYPWHDTKSDDFCSYGERIKQNERTEND